MGLKGVINVSPLTPFISTQSIRVAMAIESLHLAFA